MWCDLSAQHSSHQQMIIEHSLQTSSQSLALNTDQRKWWRSTWRFFSPDLLSSQKWQIKWCQMAWEWAFTSWGVDHHSMTWKNSECLYAVGYRGYRCTSSFFCHLSHKKGWFEKQIFSPEKKDNFYLRASLRPLCSTYSSRASICQQHWIVHLPFLSHLL